MLTSCSDLEFISDSSAAKSDYYVSDLNDLMAQTGAVDLKLKLATCLLSDGHDRKMYDESSISGYQHKVVIAIDDARNELLTVAALPCPPHCVIKAAWKQKRLFDVWDNPYYGSYI
jgi:hypothetical protein